MELRQYWNVIVRRRWLVLAVIVLATAFSAFALVTAERSYEAVANFSLRFPGNFGQTPQPGAGEQQGNGTIVFNTDYAAYYYYLSSEYQVDDFTLVVDSDAFAMAVLKTMQEELSQGRLVVSDTVKFTSDLQKLQPRHIVDMIRADRRHRELRIFVEAPTRDMSRSILDAAGIVLTNATYEPVRGAILDRPIAAQLDIAANDLVKSNATKEITNAIIRVVMGVVAALLLAFLLEYLDNSIRDEADARKVLDLPVIGAIPRS